MPQHCFLPKVKILRSVISCTALVMLYTVRGRDWLKKKRCWGRFALSRNYFISRVGLFESNLHYYYVYYWYSIMQMMLNMRLCDAFCQPEFSCLWRCSPIIFFFVIIITICWSFGEIRHDTILTMSVLNFSIYVALISIDCGKYLRKTWTLE